MALPNTKVEIAFNAGYTTPAASRTWTDVSTYVEGKYGLTINRGRPDEISQVQPSTLSLTLNNKDGRFTPEKTTGAYYPNVKKGRPIRVTSTYNAVAYTRFVGYVNEWPVTWPDSSDSVSEVAITASSRMARLGVGATLLGTVEQQVLSIAPPSAFWPLAEPADSTSAADISGNARSALAVTGGSTPPTFGESMGDGDAGVKFNSGSWLQSAPDLPTSSEWTLEFTFQASVTTPSALIGLGNNAVLLSWLGFSDLLINGTFFGSNLTDDQPHLVTISTTAGTATVYIDGASLGTTVLASSPSTLRVGYDSTNGITCSSTIGYVALWSSALTAPQVASHYAAFEGFVGDLSGARIARYAAYAAIPTAEQVIDVGTTAIDVVDSNGQTPLALMQQVSETENGILYDAKDATGSLVFKDRDHRYNLASSFTLNATTQEVQGDLQPRLDDLFLVNDASATGVGTSARVVDTTSSDDYGFYRVGIDVASADPDVVRALAEWRVGLNKQPTTRYPTVSVDVVNIDTAQAALVLAADISTRFALSALPTQAPATTADFFIEGYAESITESRHIITFNTSPTTGYAGAAGVWQLDVNNIDGPYILAL